MIYDKSACPRVGKQLVLGLLPLQSRVVIVCSDHRGATRPLAQIDGSLGKCPSPFTLHASAIASLYQEANTGPHRAYPGDVPWATDGRSASGSPRGWANQQSPAGFLRCGTCGGNLVATARSGRGGIKKYWICTTAHTRGREACANVKGIPYELLTDAVVTEFKRNFLNPVALGQLLMRELEARTAAPQAAKEEAESLQSVGNISTLRRREPRRGLPRADISTQTRTRAALGSSARSII